MGRLLRCQSRQTEVEEESSEEEEMSNQPVDFAFFEKMMRIVLRVLATIHAEKAALELALLEAGILPFERYQAIREQMLKELEPSIQQLDEADGEKLLDLLRKFEGPVQ
jgi:hypothetical protein